MRTSLQLNERSTEVVTEAAATAAAAAAADYIFLKVRSLLIMGSPTEFNIFVDGQLTSLRQPTTLWCNSRPVYTAHALLVRAPPRCRSVFYGLC